MGRGQGGLRRCRQNRAGVDPGPGSSRRAPAPASVRGPGGRLAQRRQTCQPAAASTAPPRPVRAGCWAGHRGSTRPRAGGVEAGGERAGARGLRTSMAAEGDAGRRPAAIFRRSVFVGLSRGSSATSRPRRSCRARRRPACRRAAGSPPASRARPSPRPPSAPTPAGRDGVGHTAAGAGGGRWCSPKATCSCLLGIKLVPFSISAMRE